MPSDVHVIITADDFGLAVPVNEAIELAARTGVLTSASLMVGEPAAADAVVRAQALPQLRIGLHVTVVDGRPALPPAAIPDIVDASGRLSAHLVRTGVRYFFLPRCRRQLRAEVRAQFEAYRASGLPLDHVDAHRHMHLHPTVLSAILEAARDVPVPAMRVPAEPAVASRGLPAGRRIAAWARQLALTPWLALIRFRLRRAGIRCNSDVRGLGDTGRMSETTVLRLIATIGPGVTEIFFHPATATRSSVPLPQPVEHHVAELDALCSPRVRDALTAAGAHLMAYGELPPAP